MYPLGSTVAGPGVGLCFGERSYVLLLLLSGGSAPGSGWVHIEVGDQRRFHWCQTCVCTHPEQVFDPTGITCIYLAATRPALFPLLFFAPSLLDKRTHI